MLIILIFHELPGENHLLPFYTIYDLNNGLRRESGFLRKINWT